MGKRNPFEEEFYNSMLYKNLGQTGDKVAQGIGKAVEEVGKGIGRAVEEVGKTIGSSGQGYNRVNPPPGNHRPPSSYTPPPSAPPYSGDGQYRYTPGSAPSQGPVRPRPVPPPKKPAAPAAVKPKKVKKKGGALKFVLAAAAGIAFGLFFPMEGLIGTILLAAVVLGVFLLTHAVVQGVQSGRKTPQPDAQPAAQAPAAPAPAPAPAPKVKPANTGNPELDKIIDEGNDYLQKLRRANDAIQDEGVSHSIERMETACKGIFDYVREKPEKIPQIKKFLNYYLPTTLKLLGSYEKLSRQSVKGQNISATMFDIEGMMQTIASAFEKQLDGLFSEEAMDIQADITVFESILQQEGLKNEEQTK